jgi:hypothetical protein
MLVNNRVGLLDVYRTHLYMRPILRRPDGDYWFPVQHPAYLSNAWWLHVPWSPASQYGKFITTYRLVVTY